jgi:hypothetical protein
MRSVQNIGRLETYERLKLEPVILSPIWHKLRYAFQIGRSSRIDSLNCCRFGFSFISAEWIAQFSSQAVLQSLEQLHEVSLGLMGRANFVEIVCELVFPLKPNH